ncbi:MAG: glycosyltransferase family 2 protein [Acutalibacteraceae bacterium]
MYKENSLDYPTVGIIVPIYNTEKYVGRCLHSILNNTYLNIKVFCIDDGSKDESPEIVEKIAKNDSRVIHIRRENGGVSVARNRGIEAAFKENCEVIGFVDSDDWVHPQYIEILLSGILEGYDVSICNFKRTSTLSDEYRTVNNIDRIEYDLDCIETNRVARNYIWGRLYRSAVINKTRFVKGIKINEDFLFNNMIIAVNSNLKVCWTDQNLYFYFERENSAVHSFKGKDLLPYSKECITLLSSCNDGNKKSFLTNTIFTNTFSARYLSKFDSDFLEIEKICRDLLKETWKIVKKDKIILKRKFIFRLFSSFPSLYRLFRIATDRTLLEWEKQQKNKR